MVSVYPEHIETALQLAANQDKEAVPHPHEDAPELFQLMRSKVQLEGEDYHNVYTVVAKPGHTILPHKHVEWIVLFYAEPADTPIEIEGESYLPKPGEILVMRPNVEHAVPENKTDKVRVSVAMKVLNPPLTP